MVHKVPLQYQSTEHDCGTAAIINALNYVLDFSEIPAYFLKEIYSVCLDEIDMPEFLGKQKESTSNDALRFLVSWFNRYSERKDFPLHCEYFEGDKVTFIHSNILKTLLKDKNTAIVIRCLLYDQHYITLTDIDDEFVYAFDPYYWTKGYNNPDIQEINEPFKANRKIPIDFMETSHSAYYNINAVKEKFAVVFQRTE